MIRYIFIMEQSYSLFADVIHESQLKVIVYTNLCFVVAMAFNYIGNWNSCQIF